MGGNYTKSATGVQIHISAIWRYVNTIWLCMGTIWYWSHAKIGGDWKCLMWNVSTDGNGPKCDDKVYILTFLSSAWSDRKCQVWNVSRHGNSPTFKRYILTRSISTRSERFVTFLYRMRNVLDFYASNRSTRCFTKQIHFNQWCMNTARYENYWNFQQITSSCEG